MDARSPASNAGSPGVLRNMVGKYKSLFSKSKADDAPSASDSEPSSMLSPVMGGSRDDDALFKRPVAVSMTAGPPLSVSVRLIACLCVSECEE
jgi:hypothetical protein